MTSTSLLPSLRLLTIGGSRRCARVDAEFAAWSSGEAEDRAEAALEERA